MKKILALVFSALMALMPLTACGKTDGKTTITLNEVTHSVFYAPLYIAINNGYLEDENINVELVNGGGADKVMTAVITGGAQIGLMGAEATIYCHAEGQRNYPVIFGQLTKRDGSFLVGRNSEPNFDWSSLNGKHILAGRAGGMPAMALEWVLNQNGISTDNDNFDTSVAFDAMVATFETNTSIDYCSMFEPTASQYVAAGKGHIVASIGAESGEIPYTCFAAKREWLDKNTDVAEAFLRAVCRGYKYLIEAELTDIAAALAPSFVGTDEAALIATVQNYKNIDAWSSTPVMTASTFTRMQEIMENAGTLDSRVDFNAAVDNTIAQTVATQVGL